MTEGGKGASSGAARAVRPRYLALNCDTRALCALSSKGGSARGKRARLARPRAGPTLAASPRIPSTRIVRRAVHARARLQPAAARLQRRDGVAAAGRVEAAPLEAGLNGAGLFFAVGQKGWRGGAAHAGRQE